jgi:RHS repeat-associated protein
MSNRILIILGVIAFVSLWAVPGVLAQAPTPPPEPETGSGGKITTPSQPLKVEDPVNASNGAFNFELPLLAPGGLWDLNFALIYDQSQNSMLSMWSGFTNFWWSPLAAGAFWQNGSGREIYMENGATLSFVQQGDEWVLNDGNDAHPHNGSPVRAQMKETGDYVYVLDPTRQRVYIFERAACDGLSKAKLLYVLDRNYNRLTYAYAEWWDDHCRLKQISDGLGRQLNFSYQQLGGWLTALHQVSDQAGRVVSLNYDESAPDNRGGITLRAVRDTRGYTTTFHYQPISDTWNIISRIEYPNGTPITNTYTTTLMTLPGYSTTVATRVAAQQDAFGNLTTFGYAADGYTTTVTYPDGAQETYYHYGAHTLPGALTDAAGDTARFAKNDLNQLTSVTDRLGDTTRFGYHPETGRVLTVTNTLGDTQWFTYTPQTQTFTNPANSETITFTFYDLTAIGYPDGSQETFVYDGRGNMLARTDRVDATQQYTYNARGQILTEINPAGHVITYTYYPSATLRTRADAEAGVITYTYDLYGRLYRAATVEGFIQYGYDLADRVTALTNTNGATWRYTYDGNGNLLTATDPLTHTTHYAYDVLNRAYQVTNRLGQTQVTTFDARSRPLDIVDFDGLTRTVGYNLRGWSNAITLAGRTWRTEYDSEGGRLAEITPLNLRTSYGNDHLGRLITQTNPLSETITWERDAHGRITAVHNPLGQITRLRYDARGLLIGVTPPGLPGSVYTYTALGMLGALRDLNGQVWAFDYTPGGRVAAQSDPLGNTWQNTYDSLGRQTLITYPTGLTRAHGYDAAGNLSAVSYSDGEHLTYTYDPLNNLVETQHLRLTRDAEGRVTQTAQDGLHVDAVYSTATGQLTQVTYNGAFSVTYTYNASGLLASVSAPSGALQLIYDADNRLVTLQRPNGITTTWQWDGAGRAERIHTEGLLDLQYAYDAAGRLVSAQSAGALNPVDFMTDETVTHTIDAASQFSSAGYSYDARGRLTAAPGYTFTWTAGAQLCGINATQLAYNGLGDLITRTTGVTVTRYAYNYALNGAPIVAEFDGAGNPLRYYVWTPAGELLYMVDAPGNHVYYYHFDQNGNTLLLTDESGQATDAYAYTPYGQLLHHQGDNPQPFTFAGQWGARQEDERFYQMRARTYDAANGRFISREPNFPLLDDPLALNPYVYARNNPLTDRDISGLASKTRGEFFNDADHLRAKLRAFGNQHPGALHLPQTFIATAKNHMETDDRWGTIGGARYIYTKSGQMIDLLHFFSAGEQTVYHANWYAQTMGWFMEVAQGVTGPFTNNTSGHPFGGNEDLESNSAGANFASWMEEVLPNNRPAYQINMSDYLIQYIEQTYGKIVPPPENRKDPIYQEKGWWER